VAQQGEVGASVHLSDRGHRRHGCRVTAKPAFERVVQELRSLAAEETSAAPPATSEDSASPPGQEEVVTPSVG